MVLANLSESYRYECLHPLFHEVFEYVKQHDLLLMPPGRIVLRPDILFINNDRPLGVPEEKQVLEVHRNFIDIHFLLEGKERVGWKSTPDCRDKVVPYDAARDCMFYGDEPDGYFNYKPGQFIIFWPEDAHATIIGEGTIKKSIAKVRL
ncbi:YhcH/YjgK/YiaL family protein [Porphyromonas macacae]|uniref:Uncharacterized protein, YhcH/YjgK/YiaL family n=1 Tax=Porphyromonas macacae TaxID=28115 RepID=A0A379DJQ3_9PORP|nr:YhcH/YjgK/YiaL family protein [Porphyromonas macacae]SUB77985.1 uncharacterized protein, YhcH/YjgK/YiaL family [Porphyromonas macacae]